MGFLTTAKLDSTWKRGFVHFLQNWHEQIRLFEEVTDKNSHFSSEQKRRLLENAVVSVQELQFVATEDRLTVAS